MFLIPLLLTAGLVLPTAPPSAAPATTPDDAAVIAAQMPFYPLATCPVSGEDLGGMGEAIDVVQDGRLVRLCCKGCVKKLAADPAAALAKLDAAVVAEQRTAYPLDTCPVSGEELGGMGEAIELVVEGRFVKLCCKGCVKKINADPTAYFAKLDAALIAAQIESYPLTTCPLSDEPLGDDAKNVLYGNTLIRLCCGNCVKKIKVDPSPALLALAAAHDKQGDKAGAKRLRQRAEASGAVAVAAPSRAGR